MRIFIQTMITWRLFVSEIGQHTISIMFWKDTDFDYYAFGFYIHPEIWNETSTFFSLAKMGHIIETTFQVLQVTAIERKRR